ncbi:GntR family transcriptional regulator [Streptomyces sp. NPDC048409]|uniref:GntR family transcriptional regulator n=1 Tax=Streptomyces sp. NPDC048409 TaxID=3154723 RepID=UPI0034403BC3
MTMPPADDARLAFERIADDLKQQIRSEKLQPGQLLPSHSQLMEAYGASSLTVQKAVRLLRSEGWVMTRQGKGTFVSRSADFEHAFESVVKELERQIRSGILTPGTKLPGRETLADHYAVPVRVIDTAVSLLVRNEWLRYEDEEHSHDAYVRDADDPALGRHLAHAALVQKIRNGSLPKGTRLTAAEAAEAIGHSEENTEQALATMALEGHVRKVYKNPRKKIPSRTRPSEPQPEEPAYVIGESLFWGEPGDTGGTEGSSGEQPPHPTPPACRDMDLAGKLDLILEQMADMRERLERLEQASHRPGTKRSQDT